MSGRRSRKKRSSGRRPVVVALTLVAVVAVAAAAAFLILHHQGSGTSSTSDEQKYIILYINQGNGAVNQTNFGSMVSFASAQGFNTVFFQVYREGVLLFDSQQLGSFADQAHAAGLKIFFSLYITNATQQIPSSIYGLGEDGISLDMSTLSLANQSSDLATLQKGYSGTTAMTTTDLSLPLSPDLVVIETYTSDIQQYSQYIHPGVIASVGVFATTSRSDYEQEYQYALTNSDGVMVFDYAGLTKSGY